MDIDTDAWQAIASVATVVVTVVLARVAYRLQVAIARPQQVADVFTFVTNEYYDRRFSRPLDIPRALVPGYTDESDFIPALTLRDARAAAEQQVKSKEGCSDFFEKSCEVGSWQNRFAYEAVNALEHVGWSVMVGSAPVDAVLSISASSVVRDWYFCHALVLHIRCNHSTTRRSDSTVPFHRRHAEWLACAAALYLHEHWTWEQWNRWTEPLRSSTFTACPGYYVQELPVMGDPVAQIRDRERRLRAARDYALSGADDAIERVLGISRRL